MDISQLKQIVAIVDAGSIVAASDKLFLSRPALSKSLSKLEAELGAELFERRSSGVTLTEEGKRLLPFIEKAVRAYERVERETHKLGARRNVVSIGFTYGTNAFFADEIRKFELSHPNIKLESGLIAENSVPDKLRTGEYDICCSGWRGTDAEIAQRPVLRARVLYGVPSESDAAKRGFITSAEIAQNKLLGPNYGNKSTFVRIAAKGEMRIEAATPNYESCDDMLFLFGYVKRGLGILGMPDKLADNYSVEGVSFVPEEGEGKYWQMYVHYVQSSLSDCAGLILDEVFDVL